MTIAADGLVPTIALDGVRKAVEAKQGRTAGAAKARNLSAKPDLQRGPDCGRLIPRSKIRTKKRVIKEIVSRMEQHAQDGHDYSGKCYISNSACYDDARQVAEQIEARFPRLNGRVEINHVGTTIGAHTGPGTVALFFWGKERVD